jgi:L-malate glycosyltransferase
VRILHTVEFYHPSRGGAQEVVKRVSEALVRRGHSVTVATTRDPRRRCDEIDGVRIAEFAVSGNAVVGMSGETGRFQEFLLGGEFDLVMNYAAQQWTTDLTLPVLDRLRCGKVLAPCGFSGLYQRPYAAYFSSMPRWLAAYDHLIFHSSTYRDIAFARRHGVEKLSVVPNGASAEEFEAPRSDFRRRHGIPDDVPLLLTVGSHTTFKGHRLAIEALRAAAARRAVLVIIGNTFGTPECLSQCRRLGQWTALRSLGRKRVLLLDPPRDEVVSAYHAADLFVLGSNIECSPIVLFEAAASSTPFITSSCGNAAEICEWLGGGLLVEGSVSPDGFTSTSVASMAAAIEQVLANRDVWRERAARAREAWRRSFTWEDLARQYEEVYHRVVAARAGGSWLRRRDSNPQHFG